MQTLNRWAGLLAISLTIMSCHKTPLEVPAPTPEDPAMEYLDLGDFCIAYAQPGKAVDLNKDNRNDLYFGVELVGDPIAKVDKRQFVVISSFYTSLPVTNDERVLPLAKNTIIPLDNFNQANWYNASEIVLAERIEAETGAISWQGNWLDASDKYLPVQIFKANQRYNAWVELSFDQPNQQLVLHRAAISKQPEVRIKAGL